MNVNLFKSVFGALILTIMMSASIFAMEVTGAGASFPAPLYMKWASDYEKAFNIKINYQSIGSGGGIKQIETKTVNFGASDMPVKSEELKQYGLIQFPTVIGGVVPVVNLDGITAGQLKLTGAVLADIYSGKITVWNDNRIKEINPNLILPAININVVHRSDGSGTTFLFSSYLSAVSPDWNQKIGANTSIAWPVGIGGKGNEGVSSYVQRIKGAIGYVEYAYAFQNTLPYTLMQNKDGNFVTPSMTAFQSAASHADWNNSPDFGILLINNSGKETWPISGVTFILMNSQQTHPEQGKEVLKFFDWAYKNGGKTAESLFYVPIPASVVTSVEKKWQYEIKDQNNQGIWKNN